MMNARQDAAVTTQTLPQPPTGALHGVRIIDLTSVVMGPYATQIMGDFGADVIKVEPLQGDALRHVGPARNHGMGPLFLHINRNKRSIALDLKTPEGCAAVLRLCAQADVIAYNLRPQAMARLGLGYEQLRAHNPKIIYAGMFGFNRDGPYAKDPAYDDLIQGLSGFPAVYAQATGNAPAYVPANICDRTVGLYAVGAICAALFYRERSGHGQMLDIPMFETMAQFVMGDHLYGETFVPKAGSTGYARLISHERKPYATSDGFLCVVPYTDRHWKSFFALANKAELLSNDARFSNVAQRTAHIDVLYRMVSEILKTDSTANWLKKLKAADIPVAAMHSMESILEDAHLNTIGFFKELEHPSEGRIRLMDTPSAWSVSKPTIAMPAPRLGEHTREILAELDYAPAAIASLIEQRIAGAAQTDIVSVQAPKNTTATA